MTIKPTHWQPFDGLYCHTVSFTTLYEKLFRYNHIILIPLYCYNIFHSTSSVLHLQIGSPADYDGIRMAVTL